MAHPVGRESEAPPADPFYGATRRTIQRPSNNIGGGDAAGETDRREALRFPALRVRGSGISNSCGREAPGKRRHFRAPRPC
ncbi:MAG: hypothetical protein LBS49_10225, partial [Candidatus Accumulibacter sp.]|nr:hypothetical protein [Accumulibacter sp.]